MPLGDPWSSIATLLEAELAIRNGAVNELDVNQVDDYWVDLVRLLQVFAAKKRRDVAAIAAIRGTMVSPVYSRFVDRVIRKLAVAKPLN